MRFSSELARSLHNLGEDLAANKRLQEALVSSQKAVDIRRQLAATWPDAFRPDLATSLHSLANRFAALGHQEEALAAGQEAVDIRRQLATSMPDAVLPDLAASLSNLGPWLLMADRPAEALAASEEAVEIDRKLAVLRPEAFSSELASSLCNLSQALARMGQMAEAARASGEGLEAVAPLVQRHPSAFCDLARKLGSAVIVQSRQAGIEPDMAMLERVAGALGRHHRPRDRLAAHPRLVPLFSAPPVQHRPCRGRASDLRQLSSSSRRARAMPGRVRLAHGRRQPALPGPVELTPAAVGIAVRLSGAVLLPQQHERHAGPAQLAVDMGPGPPARPRDDRAPRPPACAMPGCVTRPSSRMSSIAPHVVSIASCSKASPLDAGSRKRRT